MPKTKFWNYYKGIKHVRYCYKHVSPLKQIDCKLIEANKSSLTETVLFGNSLFDSKKELP